MRVLTLLNEKGGVGKTTLAVHIAAGLAINGARVLFIDTDPQGNGTTSFNVMAGKYQNLFGLLIDAEEWRDVLVAPSPESWAGDYVVEGRLSVLAGNIKTRLIPASTDNMLLMRQRLEELEGLVDWVIMDTSPTPSLLNVMLLNATTHTMHPTQLEALSLSGLGRTLEHIEAHNSSRPRNQDEVQVLGIQPTMYRAGTTAHQTGLQLLDDAYGEMVYPPTSLRIVWSEASYAGQTVFAYAPDSPACDEAWGLVGKVQLGVMQHG